jgi:hypothetical protein
MEQSPSFNFFQCGPKNFQIESYGEELMSAPFMRKTSIFEELVQSMSPLYLYGDA